MCRSICPRAFGFTEPVKLIEIGMATPTVVSLSGAMPSKSIGGPLGKCFFLCAGVADAEGELLGPTDDAPAEGGGASLESDPAQAAVASSRPATTPTDMVRRLQMVITG